MPLTCHAPVERVARSEDHVTVSTKTSTEQFDHVIFACHSDQALKILDSDATKTEREVLSMFPYSRNVAVLHTDESLLPRSRRAWASWNYRVDGETGSPPSVTYNMSLLMDYPQLHAELAGS